MQPLLLSLVLNVRGARAVQLAHTRPDGAAVPDRDLGDACELAARYVADGARRLLVIDLDAATGAGSNLVTAAAIRARTGAQVTLSGGLRDDAAVQAAFDAGLDRVQLGTGALDTMDWAATMFARYGDRVAAALDVLEGGLTTHGRTVRYSGDVPGTVRDLEAAGCRRFAVRCLDCDGRRTGPNYELLGEVCALSRTGSGAAVTVAGGVGSLEDLRRLRGLVPIGLEGVAVGTAVYQGLFSVAEALEITEGERPLTSPLAKENE